MPDYDYDGRIKYQDPNPIDRNYEDVNDRLAKVLSELGMSLDKQAEVMTKAWDDLLKDRDVCEKPKHKKEELKAMRSLYRRR